MSIEAMKQFFVAGFQPSQDEHLLSALTVEQLFNELFTLLKKERDEYFENIVHLETMLKAVVLSLNGKFELSKDFLHIVTNNNYFLKVNDEDDSIKLDLIQADESEEEEDDE